MMNRYLPLYAALILCSLIAASCMAQSTAMPAGDTAALSHALSAYDSGNGAAAIPELKRLAVKYPNNFPANEALGLLYADEGNYAQALPYLKHAANAKKTNAVAQANLGAAYLQTGDVEAAVRSLKSAAELDGKNGQTLSNLGHALYLNKQPQEAADAFARAATASPADMNILYDWALALHQAGNDAQASAVFQRIPAEQRNEEVESLWGDVAEKQGQFKEAADHMQAAMQLNPSEPNVYALTVELLRHWTWQPAAEIAQYGVKHFPESRRLQLAQGIAFYGSKHYIESAATFGALLALDPDNETYGDLLGKNCSALGWSGAPQCDTLIEFADKHPANAHIAVYAATSILHNPGATEKLDHVQQMLERAIRIDPRIAEAYDELGVSQQDRSQWNESVKNLSKAAELRPAYPEAHYRLVLAYTHMHQTELANKERALLLKYNQQVQDDSNAILKEVTTFLTTSH